MEEVGMSGPFQSEVFQWPRSSTGFPQTVSVPCHQYPVKSVRIALQLMQKRNQTSYESQEREWAFFLISKRLTSSMNDGRTRNCCPYFSKLPAITRRFADNSN